MEMSDFNSFNTVDLLINVDQMKVNIYSFFILSWIISNSTRKSNK